MIPPEDIIDDCLNQITTPKQLEELKLLVSQISLPYTILFVYIQLVTQAKMSHSLAIKELQPQVTNKQSATPVVVVTQNKRFDEEASWSTILV